MSTGLDALDTLWNHFLMRMASVNPQRKLMGYMDAQQWPPKQVQFDAFYLISLGSSPVEGESIAVPIYVHTVQFTWMNKGTDVNVASNVLGANRGNRIRTYWQMKDECEQACWPYFAQKQTFNVDPSQSVTVQRLNEPVKWTKPQFTLHSDKASGLLYSTASVRITSMEGPINVDAPSDNAYAPCQ